MPLPTENEWGRRPLFAWWASLEVKPREEHIERERSLQDTKTTTITEAGFMKMKEFKRNLQHFVFADMQILNSFAMFPAHLITDKSFRCFD